MSARPDNVEPKVHAGTISNPIHANQIGSSGNLEPAPTGHLITTTVRDLIPNGRSATHAAGKANPGSIKINLHSGSEVIAMNQGLSGAGAAIRGANSATHLMSITRGQRIPNIGQFAIELNSQFVKFDVQPRVDDGVPMTPLRYLLEKDGGKVDWENMTKTVKASADGKSITIQIGDRNARVDEVTVSMEVTPYLDRGRTIVPLSFIHDALGVNVEYDKETGHVLMTSTSK
jgi:hypothetical protein